MSAGALFLALSWLAPAALCQEPPSNEPVKPATVENPANSETPTDKPSQPQTVLKPVIEDKLAPLSQTEVYQRLLRSTAWIVIRPDAKHYTSGTAWVADANNRLLVTNHHVIRNSTGTVDIYFPSYQAGELNKDASHYLENLKPTKGHIVYSELKRDLAVIQVDAMPSTVVELKLAAASPAAGERLHAVAAHAAGSGGLWPYANGAVHQVFHRKDADGFDGQVVETQLPVNFGNSGGAVANDLGQLTAVVMGYQGAAQLVSLFIDISEVRAFLDQARPLIDPQTAQLFKQRADNHYSARRYELAMTDYTKALDLDPQMQAASVRQAWIFYYRNDMETALAEFNDVLKDRPRLPEGFHGRALVYRSLGKLTEAVADLNETIRLAPSNANSVNLRGEIHLAASQPQSALNDFLRAINLSPNNPLYYANAGRAFDDLGQYNKAIQAHTDAIKHGEKTPKYYLARGTLLRELQRYEEALNDFKKAIELDPSSGAAYKDLGLVSLAKNDHQQAAKLFDQAIERDNKSATAFTFRAIALRNMGRLDEAEKDLKVALGITPQDPGIINHLGLVWYIGKRYESAEQAFTRAAELSPKTVLYHQNLGETLQAMKKYDQAAKALTTAINLAPQRADLFATRGAVLQEGKDAKGSAADFQKAIQLDPKRFALARTKRIVVTNNTGEPLKVFVNCFTHSADGKWNWYPKAPGTDKYEFSIAAGQSLELSRDDWKLHGNRLRIWATGATSGREWTTYKTKDLETAPAAGYLSDPEKLPAYAVSFP